MSKRKSSKYRDRATAPATGPLAAKNGSGEQGKSHMFSQSAVRETIESVVIAFVLAFLFRTFEAEAFVIPTGSMAPTLMGRHKDFECPVCGHWYQISASEEVDQKTNRSTGRFVRAGTCPMCRFTADVGPNNPQGKNYPSYSGDRILVGKFAYQFGEPERWDVAVFKYPGNAVTNYIKRIVGLPDETVVIRGGDIFIAGPDEPRQLEIARKAPDKLLAMLQPVFDNQYMPKLVPFGFPARWTPDTPPGVSGRFEPIDPDGVVKFHTDGSAPREEWLRYAHRVPSSDDWLVVARDGRLPPGREPAPEPIRDFTAYNTSRRGPAYPLRPDVLGNHWVGDLAVECAVEVLSDAGEVMLELVEGGERFQVRFDVAAGEAVLSASAMPDWAPTASTSLRGPGTYRLRFANCDDKLYVWVNDRYVAFDGPTRYTGLENDAPTEADLHPAAVGARGCALRVTDLRILRDVYYIAASSRNGRETVRDFQERNTRNSPDMWITRSGRRQEVFQLEADQFFMLGDNSLRSKDSRLWAEKGGPDHYVDREALIGKAILIYWPHSWHRIPGTPIPFPFFPNFARMGFVR